MRRAGLLYLLLCGCLIASWQSFAQMPMTGAGIPLKAAGGGGGGCSQATTFLARTSLTGSDVTNYTNLICGMVTDGLITGNMSTTGCGSLFDAIYILATKDTTTANLNLCSTSFSLTAHNSPSFSAYNGYTGNGSNAYLDTGANPGGTWSGNYSVNSAHWSHWNLTNNTSDQIYSGNSNNGASFQIFATNFYPRVNDTLSNISISDLRGHIFANRSTSTLKTVYQNGSSIGTDTGMAAISVVNADFVILWSGDQSGNASVGQAAEYSIGASLNGTQVSNFYSRLRTYMTAVGVP